MQWCTGSDCMCVMCAMYVYVYGVCWLCACIEHASVCCVCFVFVRCVCTLV